MKAPGLAADDLSAMAIGYEFAARIGLVFMISWTWWTWSAWVDAWWLQIGWAPAA